MAQKNIDFGTYPDDPDADAIRSAFQKTQENFNEIFAGLSDQGVLSINKTPQAGITVSSTTGNVLISANLSCVTVQSNTLQLTINNSSPANTQIIDSASKILQINFPSMSNIPNANIAGNLTVNGWANFVSNATINVVVQGGNIVATNNITATNGILNGNLSVAGNIANANNVAISNVLLGNTANFSGNVILANIVANALANVGNLLVNANVQSNLLPNANLTYDLGSSTQRWDDVFANNVNISSNITAGNIDAGNLLTANFLTGTLTTAAQPNITSVGILTSLTVSGNANVGNIGSAAGVFTANVTAGNVYANSGTVGASLLTGTLTTAAQPNITSVGTLTSLGVTGNLSSGNANLGNLASANFLQGDGYLISNLAVGAGTYISNGTTNVAIATSGGNVTVTVGGTTNAVVFTSTGVNVAGYANIVGNANIGNVGATRFVGNLEGTVLTNAQTNITSVGNLSGLTVNGISNLGPNGNVRITGGVANSFLMTNGTGNLSWNTGTLVPAQGSDAQIIFNDGGSNYAGNTGFTFIKATGNVAIPGSLDVVGNVSGGNLSSPGALSVTGNILAGNISTGTGTFTALIVNGPINAGNISGNNITGNSFAGNGNGITFIAGANVNGQVGNALVAGTVYTNAQPNITSLGTLTSLGVNGTVTAVAFTANTGIFTGNGAGLTNIPGANITGNISGNISNAQHACTANTVTNAAQSNITSVGTLTSLGVSGNITAANITANTGIFAGNGAGLTNLAGANVTGQVGFAAVANSVAGANVTGQVANALVAGTVYTAAQPNITSVGTLTSLGVNGTVTAVAFTANTGVFTGNGSGLTNLPAGNISGQVANALVAGTVYTAAQPNITSVGTLTSLSVTGNVTAGNLIGIFANGNSNIRINANANVLISSKGNANVVVITDTGANIAGTANITSQTVIGNSYGSLWESIMTYGMPLAVVGSVEAESVGNNTVAAFYGSQGYSANRGGEIALGGEYNFNNTKVQFASISGIKENGTNGDFSGALTLNTRTNGNAITEQVRVNSVGNVGIGNSNPLDKLSVNGNIVASNNITAAGYHIRSVGTGISAAGSTQGTATALTKEFNQVTTVSSGQGVVLPTAVAGMAVTITNTSANNLSVYPASAAAINTLSANAAFTQGAGSTLQFIAMTSTQWYTVGATYA